MTQDGWKGTRCFVSGPEKGGPGAGASQVPKPEAMSTHKKHKSPSKGSNKTPASKRTINPPLGDGSHQADTGSNTAFQQHDQAHRQGSFEGAGNHARTGN